MGSFKLVELDEFSYNTPQEMYADRKNRSIQSLFDHQSKMIDLYMREFETRDVSLELPPGSGKTLVGLLIGEFRRLKNREKSRLLLLEQAASESGLHAIEDAVWHRC